MLGDADTFPVEGRLMGIDFGTKRIGVAISTPEQNIASPLENYNRRTKQLDGEFLAENRRRISRGGNRRRLAGAYERR